MKTNLQTLNAKCTGFFLNHGVEVSSAVTSVAALMMVNMASADAASDLLKFIIDAIGKLILALAVILAIMGLVSWATASSEGDGPALNKAKMTLAAAIMLVILSIVLLASKDTLAGILTGATVTGG
ncbi:MAG: hypothetical protein K6G10_06800 [Butyrivibrio sp.]|nr:hypothetical protein [Butyrivibrio sp.]